MRLHLATVLAWSGDYQEAIHHAKLVIKATPSYWDAYLLLARIAGWQGNFKEAFEHLEPVLRYDPKHTEARNVKLDLLMWSHRTAEAEELVQEIIDDGTLNADIIYQKARISRMRLNYLRAYLLAKEAQKLDPFHKGAKKLIEDTRWVALFMSHTFEYTDFPSGGETDVSAEERFGYTVTVAGQAWPRARLSAVISETFRYRYLTLNNRVGLSLIYRVIDKLELTLGTKLGAPAEVIPLWTFWLATRLDFTPWVDITGTYALDILPWPADEPALLQRPTLDLGVSIKDTVRLGAAYTLGLLHYCSKPVQPTHTVRFSILGKWNAFSVQGFYGYGEETDKSDTALVAPNSCDEIDDMEEEYKGTLFGLVGIQAHTVGAQTSYDFLKNLTLNLSYFVDFRYASTNNIMIPTHTITIGGNTWF
jgi:hypothetical protein